MNLKELYQKLRTLGIPCAYHHFDKSEKVSPPFVVYFDEEGESISADAKNFGMRRDVRVELYNEQNAPKLEKDVETLLDGIAYDKTRLWLSDEEIYMVVYEFELIEKER